MNNNIFNFMETAQTSQLEFINSLVLVITGSTLDTVSDDKKSEVADKCLDVYKNYIIGYFVTNFEDKDVIRLKQILETESTSSFEKFPELKEKFEESYKSFIEFLK
jgi:hypothetical protein